MVNPGGGNNRRRNWVPPEEWYASLPGFTCSAGALITGPDGTALIVKPWYRDTWVLRGGVTEANESPRQCAEREVKEETGLTVQASRLLAVHWIPAAPQRRPIIAWLFDGGSVPDKTNIRIDPDELDAYLFAPLDEALSKLAPRAARRLEAAWTARRYNRPAYLEGIE